MSDRIGYLGPPGTFTEEALLSLPESKTANLVPFTTVPEIIDAIEQQRLERGMVPIENSIEGSVNVTLDALAFATEHVTIEREIVLPIRHALITQPGASLDGIHVVVSHPHATAQCRTYLMAKLPGAQVLAANSTAEAAQMASQRGAGWAAIGTPLAAQLYNLAVLEEDIEDRRENSTRFVLLGREAAAPTGSDKTSVVCFIEKDRPGSLLAILHEFSDRDINLLKLESRPTKQRLGEYCFFIDMEGHAEQPPVNHALHSLRTKILEVKVLGSYPRATDA